MSLKIFTDIQFDQKSIVNLFKLPSPENSKLNKYSTQSILDACNGITSALKKLLINDFTKFNKPYSYKCPHGHVHKVNKDEVPNFIFLILSSYLDHFLIHLFANKNISDANLPNCFKTSSAKDLIPEAPTEDTVKNSYQIKILLHHYYMAMSSMFFVKLLSKMPTEIPPVKSFQSIFHDSIADLHRSSANCKGDYAPIAGKRLLQGSLNFASYVYSEISEWQPDHRPAIFSTIHIKDLPGLAERNQVLVKKYGERQTDKMFEQQLSLIFQSFGFYVTSSQIGTNIVDLICISSDSLNKYSFLVEAKSSKGPYTLPAKDSRAIIEYVSSVRQALYTMPQLSFVLIVGQNHSKTIKSKLNQLEMETGIPVRYVAAKDIAKFRESIPGPASSKVFHDQILLSPNILSTSTFSSISSCMKSEQQAHTAFIGAMLSAKGITPKARNSWPSHNHENSQPSTE